MWEPRSKPFSHDLRFWYFFVPSLSSVPPVTVPPSLRLSFSVCLFVCACAGALQVIRMQFVYCRFLMTWACVRELVADLERFGFWDSVSVTLHHSAQSTQHTFVHHSSSLPIRLSIFCRCMHFLFAFCHTLLIIVAVLGLGEDRHWVAIFYGFPIVQRKYWMALLFGLSIVNEF